MCGSFPLRLNGFPRLSLLDLVGKRQPLFGGFYKPLAKRGIVCCLYHFLFCLVPALGCGEKGHGFFAFSPSSTSRHLFKTYLRVRTACTVRFSLRAIRSFSILESGNAKSCSSSAGVQGRPVGRGPSFISPSPSAPPSNSCPFRCRGRRARVRRRRSTSHWVAHGLPCGDVYRHGHHCAPSISSRKAREVRRAAVPRSSTKEARSPKQKTEP